MASPSALLLGAGVALFVVLRVPPRSARAVWDNLRLIGWGFVLDARRRKGVSYLLNTTGWRFAFPPPRPPSPLLASCSAARLAGEAINNLTPDRHDRRRGGARPHARRASSTPARAWASIAIAKLMQTFAQMSFVFLGLLLVVRAHAVAGGLRARLLIGLARR